MNVPFGPVGGSSIGTRLDLLAALTWAFLAERVTRVELAFSAWESESS
jgi:hypothetical protein